MFKQSKWWLSFGFLMVFGVAFMGHLPASWLVQQATQNKALPSELILEDVSGVWWQGRAHLKVTSDGQSNRFGQVAWQLDWMSLFSAQIEVALTWKPSVGSQVTARLITDGQYWSVRQINGELAVSQIAIWVPQAALLSDAEGRLFLRDVALRFDSINSPIWPNQASGKLALIDFSAMGMNVKQVEVMPVVQQQDLVLQISGGDKGWKLTGETRLQPNRFQHNLKLSANSAKSMPDWVGLFMRQTSSTQAKLTTKGRF